MLPKDSKSSAVCFPFSASFWGWVFFFFFFFFLRFWFSLEKWKLDFPEVLKNRSKCGFKIKVQTILRILQCLIALENLLSGKLKSFHKYQPPDQCPGAIDLLSSLTPFPGECSLILFWGITSPIVCRCGRAARTQASTWSPLVRFFIISSAVGVRLSDKWDHSEAALLPVFLWHDSPMSPQFCELVHILPTNSFSVHSSGCNCKALVIQSPKLECELHDAGAVVETARELPSALSSLPADFQFYLVWEYVQQKCSPWHWFAAVTLLQPAIALVNDMSRSLLEISGKPSLF